MTTSTETNTGILIAIEGIDGSGKTTQARRLAERMGSAAHATCEPSSWPIGRLIRQVLAGEHAIDGRPIDPKTMALLFAADRTDHVQREVDVAIKAGKIVVSDRWYHSSLAYQTADDASFEWVVGINQHITAPDLTIFLSVDPRVTAARRVSAGRTHELFDDLETQLKIEEGYRRAISHLRTIGQLIMIVDGGRSPDSIADTIHVIVRDFCQARRQTP